MLGWFSFTILDLIRVQRLVPRSHQTWPVINQPDPPETPRSTRLHLETVAVTAGRPERVVDAPLNPPVVFASTYVGTHDTSAASIGYGRYGNPTWQALEQAIGALEGGPALTFASGMAAAHAVLELMPPSGVIVIPDNCYLGVAEAIDRRATRYGGQVRRVNVADTTEVLTAAEGADVVWIESPTNPTIEVADLPTLGKNLAQSISVRRGQHLRNSTAAASAGVRRRHRAALGHQAALGSFRRTARRPGDQSGRPRTPFTHWTQSAAPSALLPVQWRPILRCVACVRCRCA